MILNLTYNLDLDNAKLKQHSKYLDQKSCISKVIVPPHTHTHTPGRLFYLNH